MPKISIIMPVYNKQNYLERSLDSVLNQSFSDFELIVIDDGSTDSSMTILEKYRSMDPRIKLIHSENHGVSHARNIGLDHITGKYITFVDADDELKQEYLTSLYKNYKDSGADIVINGITKVTKDGRNLEMCKGYSDGIYRICDILPDFASIQKNTGVFGYCVSKLFSSEFCGETRFDEGLNLAEDFDYYLKLYRKAQLIYMSNRLNYLYYQDTSGSSSEIKDEMIDYFSQFKINLRYQSFLEEMNCYSGKNKKIVDQIISSNAFHTLFYSNDKEFVEKCAYIRNKIDDSVNFQDISHYKKAVLNAAIKGNYQVSRLLIKLYKSLRSIKRKLSW